MNTSQKTSVVNRSSDLSKTTPTSTRSKIAHVQGTVHRDASPTMVSRILVGRGINLSPSPFRRGADEPENDSTLKKDFQQYKALEKQMAERITLLKQEMASLKKVIFKNENDIKLKTAKLDGERDKILEVLVSMVGKKQASISSSEKTVSSSQVLERSPKRLEGLSGLIRSNSLESNARVIEDRASKVNRALKFAINQNKSLASGPMRALARAVNWD